jgi:NTE family protein
MQLAREWARAQERKTKRYQRFVTFSDLRAAGGLPLAIVASDVSRRTLRLFSTNSTPDVLIAEAVAASMALPILFKPARISHPDQRDVRFFDGGFTSNLPAWPFDVQREIDLDLYTILVEIMEESERPFSIPGLRILLRPFMTFRNLVLTTIFGARPLEVRRTRSVTVTMDPGIPLLKLNLSPIRANNIVANAARNFRATMDRRAEHRRLYQRVCRAHL